jgi:hypothetical protein
MIAALRSGPSGWAQPAYATEHGSLGWYGTPPKKWRVSSRLSALIDALWNGTKAAVSGREATAVGRAKGGIVAVGAANADGGEVDVVVRVGEAIRVEDGSGVAQPASTAQSTAAARLFIVR